MMLSRIQNYFFWTILQIETRLPFVGPLTSIRAGNVPAFFHHAKYRYASREGTVQRGRHFVGSFSGRHKPGTGWRSVVRCDVKRRTGPLSRATALEHCDGDRK